MRTITSEIYQEMCNGIDGKKYLENTTFGFPFLSRHKPNCRKLKEKGEYMTWILDKDGNKEDMLVKWFKYIVYTYDQKNTIANANRWEMNKNICKGCGHSCNNYCPHFPEDEIV